MAPIALAIALTLFSPGAAHPTGSHPPAPLIGKVEPGSGPASGGTRITIEGFYLLPGATVIVGGVKASEVEFVAQGKLAATTGPHPPGRVSVTVTNPDGQSGSLGWSFRYLADR